MSWTVSVGQAFSLEGRDAATEALYEALAGIETRQFALVLVFVSHEYNMQEVLGGILTQLGDVPLMGFSTSGELTREGIQRRSVVVALFNGEGFSARSIWLPGFTQDPRRVTEQMLTELAISARSDGTLLAVADGIGGDGDIFCQYLPPGRFTVAGGLAGGDLRLEQTYQFGGAQTGSDGLAAAWLQGDIHTGVGVGHGWRPVGVNFNVTDAREFWVRTLDDKPATEMYAAMFGRQARDWTAPPLNSLVRLYPIGLELPGQDNLVIRTPLKVEADGSLRMNTTMEYGMTAHLLVGSSEQCMSAGREAAQKALKALGDVEPKLALIFADISWEMLLKGQPGSEVEAVQEVIGTEVPIAGGYTFGQIARSNGDPAASFYNQHIEVVLLG